MKILVSSNFTGCAHRPGAFDNRMAFVLGLERLGHEVYVVEDVTSERCFDDNFEPVSFDAWEGKERFRALAEAYGIWPRCCVIYEQGSATYGMSFPAIRSHARSADLLVSVASSLRTEAVRDPVPRRVYIDLAPAKVQVYHDGYGIDYGFEHYGHFFTFGFNIGRAESPIPDCGVHWQGMAPPVLLSKWHPLDHAENGRFTTVSSWAGSKHTFELDGVYSGDKADEWRRFAALPTATEQEMEIALNIHPAYEEDITLLTSNRWILRDASELKTPEDYRRYITGSRAEFSVANARYVRFNTGFFGDRTARYLASGRPALIQRTGFDEHLPVGEGLLTFETLEEAAAGIEDINRRYEDHCRAARNLAEEHLDAEKVLSDMLSRIGL